MSDGLPIDLTDHFLALLRAADRFARTRKEVVRLLQTHPLKFFPVAFACALEDRGRLGRTAVAVLREVVDKTNDEKILRLAYCHFQETSTSQSSLAVTVGFKLFHKYKKSELPSDSEFCATLLNSLAEWLNDCGRIDEALACGQEAVRRFRAAAIRTPVFRRFLAVSLMTLSKRFSGIGDHTRAQETALEALGVANTIEKDRSKLHIITLLQANVCYATALSNTGKRQKALAPARVACVGFASLDRAGFAVKMHEAFACYVYSRGLTEFGRHRHSLPYAQKAYDLFGVLVADNPDAYLEVYLAAANILCINLAHHGETGRAAEISARCIEYLRDLAERLPQRFARAHISYLITYSASRGKHLKLGSALEAAKAALTEAQKLKRVVGKRDLILEGTAQVNLFNRQYDTGNFAVAKRHATAALDLFEQIKKDHPARAFHLTQALRSLAEVVRVTSRSHRGYNRARRLANRGERQIANHPNPLKSEALIELSGYCATTIAMCYADEGDFLKAARKERDSLQKRKMLFSRSPKVYRRGVAFSLCSIARYELALASPITALRLIGEALRHYAYLARDSAEQTWMFRLRAMRVKAQILVALNRKRKALRCLENAVGLFDRYLKGSGNLIRFERDGLLREHLALTGSIRKTRIAKLPALIRFGHRKRPDK